VIRRLLKDPAISKENVYNIDETGVMLSMLGTVKVLVGKDDMRDYRGALTLGTRILTLACNGFSVYSTLRLRSELEVSRAC
jgi:hypothetical protein